ncbi:MAG: hypothetical protein LBG07_03855 [Treponema sp.]|nr:hypothetical protein [Treponema sp.]
MNYDAGVLNSRGKIIEIRKIDYKKNVMPVMGRTNDWSGDAEGKNDEYLFMIKKF